MASRGLILALLGVHLAMAMRAAREGGENEDDADSEEETSVI